MVLFQCKSISRASVQYIIDHVFLPPKLPQGTTESSVALQDGFLLEALIQSLQNCGQYLDTSDQEAVQSLYLMMTELRRVRNENGTINEGNLLNSLQDLLRKGGSLPIHVTAQNAALLLSKCENTIHAAAFELSPPNSVVMTTKGRLRRAFPSATASIHVDTFSCEDFTLVLAQTVAKMSQEVASEAKPKSKKAGKMHFEDRDTINPRILVGLLMSFLGAVGWQDSLSGILKNTREDILCSKTSLPWRRSPLWLLLRVSMQMVLSRSSNPRLYKVIMIHFMSDILDLAFQQEMQSDIIHCMIAKISRRMRKYGRADREKWSTPVEGVLCNALDFIEGRWNEVMQADFRVTDRLEDLSALSDIEISLPNLDHYIEKLRSQHYGISSQPFKPISMLVQHPSDELPSLAMGDMYGKSLSLHLAGIESWVETELDAWLSRCLLSRKTCGSLRTFIQEYHTTASDHYHGNPEALSMMLLAIMDLWVACDKSATNIHPMLKAYDPGIHHQLFQSLILPFKVQMERLANVENYLSDRRSQIRYSSPIFSDFGSSNSVAARFFDESLDHQDLLSQIQQDASKQRQSKTIELSQLKEEYSHLMRQYESSVCEYDQMYDSDTEETSNVHRSRCQRCSYFNRASSMEISVYEWPLPEDTIAAKCTVFELSVPQAINNWRDATFFLNINVLLSNYCHDEASTRSYKPNYCLSNYVKELGQRVSLVSETKPHTVTHYRHQRVSHATASQVCVNNGLSYRYFDNNQCLFVYGTTMTDRISKMYTYQLPTSASCLQSFIFRPPGQPSGLSPNTVVSTQSLCPDDMKLEEYRALATLPTGYRVQWSNILLQLFAPSVDFKRIETNLVILQIIRQAGPPSEGQIARASHLELCDEVFATRLLEGLQEGLKRVKENWESSIALGTLTSLACRILSMSSTTIQVGCLDFLSACRRTAFEWTRHLLDRAHQAHMPEHRTEFFSKAFETAHLCTGTFDVDQHHLKQLLALPAEVALLIESSIIIQETSQIALTGSDDYQAISVHRWRHQLYRAFPILAGELTNNGDGLDRAILGSWAHYCPGGQWESSTSAPEWLVTKTTQKLDTNVVVIHFNLLTAELLVNGLPVARLPERYTAHPMYKKLFGRAAIEVMPSNVSGMRFSAKRPHQGYQVSFGMRRNESIVRASDDLTIVAIRDNERYDLLPQRLLQSHVPDHFAQEHVQWYRYTTNTIELRQVHDPWPAFDVTWTMTKRHTGWIMSKDDHVLLGVSNGTAGVISSVLGPMESTLHLHIFLHRGSHRLEVELPRLNISFHLKKDSLQLQSREYRGMYVDKSQQIGTLVGLQTKLVLRNDKGDRMVLIPNGPPQESRDENHVRVSIVHGSSTKTLPFYVDERIGRFVDDGSLQSKLVLCRLHALTSYCLPDELTRKTGTEQALEILRSASVRSFESLTQENMEMLHGIASQAPRRKFYPQHLKTMQQVDWNKKLSFMSQHGDFYTSVQSILEQAQSLAFFNPEGPRVIDISDHTDMDLLRRDLIRCSTFHVWGFGGEHYRQNVDGHYESRNEPGHTNRSTAAFLTAKMMFLQRPVRQHQVVQGLAGHLERLLKTSRTTIGPDGGLAPSVVQYSADRLEGSAENLSEYWCRIHDSIHRYGRFQKMIFLTVLAFSQDADTQAIQVLVAITNSISVSGIEVPRVKEFKLQEGHKVKDGQLKEAVRSSAVSFEQSPDFNTPKRIGESPANLRKRGKTNYKSNKSNAVDRFTKALAGQWPCEVPQNPFDPQGDGFGRYINTTTAMRKARELFRIWFENLRFYRYLEEVEMQLGLLEHQPLPAPVSQEVLLPPKNVQPSGFIPNDALFCKPAPLFSIQKPLSLSTLAHVPFKEGPRHYRLSTLVERLENKADSIKDMEYAEDLRASLACLQGRGNGRSLLSKPDLIACIVSENFAHCQTQMMDCYEKLVSAIRESRASSVSSEVPLKNFSTSEASCFATYQMPRLCPTLFLQCLSRKGWSTLSQDWKQAIVAYGLAISNLQRAERINSLSNRETDLVKELSNPGHENWDPLDNPESLLMEIESGITIRKVQEDIAATMRSPPKNVNSMMQLNMGEGKSSVIVPIVAAKLADGKRLVRVIVAKPQRRQMLHMITSKLGGLCDRQVYHMPFSRSLTLSSEQAQTIDRTYRQCMQSGGILLVQPEHILSLRLMGIECMVSDRMALGQKLLSTQHFFNDYSRDIVDESDENFSVKFELIYTMGTQQPIELSPERWSLIQAVLKVFSQISQEAQRSFPRAIEVANVRPGAFPRIRILHQDAQKQVLQQVAQRLCETGLANFPVARQPQDVRDAVYTYITQAELSQTEIEFVESGKFWTETTRNPLFLVRGLIAGGILGFVFSQKRWRVNYGLDSSRWPRTRLALPFRAKDSPAPRSEFSHPDVVILLTSLSYYYGGLDDEELFLAFGHLVRSDQADMEYQGWIQDAPSLPPELRQLVSINLRDRFHCVEKVFPHLQRAKAVIDYFLAYVVFPKEMREFTQKLSASGWDIGETKTHPTTGFSGTIDSKHFLPRYVQHLDLDGQRHTNALVLECLLRSENTVELLPAPDCEVGSDAEHLLHLVTGLTPQVQVILDVGAQVLELSNLQVARAWLEMIDDQDTKQAAIFFNHRDELCVLDRRGNVEPLQTSPFAKQPDLCVVFLDEAHTRGTDLKLPEYYRAAVTLGANLTKDRLVQACMRMRRLGNDQKVVFCVPQEIQTKILEAMESHKPEHIQVIDILEWAIHETGLDLSRSMPLWAMQGARFERQKQIWRQSRTAKSVDMTESQAELFLEDEAQSLDHRYRPRQQGDQASEFLLDRDTNENVRALYELCSRFNNLRFTSASLQEEQERELAPEIEQERQIERPPPTEPEQHFIHPDVRNLINAGIIAPASPAFVPAFVTLQNTSAAAHLDPMQFPQDLLVTADFAKTIKLSARRQALPAYTDAFQRPVQWILSALAADDKVRFLVIISPYEVQELLPMIKTSKKVVLHLYAPRLNLAYHALDDLRLYTIPELPVKWSLSPDLSIQLNLFAGQLYFGSFKEYNEACNFLGLSWKAIKDEQRVEADGFILRPPDDVIAGFRESPVSFLKVHMTKIRRDCQSIEKTHWGRVLGGELLRKEDFTETVPRHAARR